MRPDPRQPPLDGLDAPPPPKKGFEPQPSRAPRFRRPIHSVAGLRERARITADPHAKAALYAAVDMIEESYRKIAELRGLDLDGLEGLK